MKAETITEKQHSPLSQFIHIILVLLIVFIIYVAGYIGYYYWQNIRPYQAIIQQILTNADKEHKHLSNNLQSMLTASLSCPDQPKNDWGCNFEDNLDYRATRLLVTKPDERKPLEQQGFEIMVNKLLITKLNNNDKYTLIAELTPFTVDKIGYQTFSQYYFDKSLNELTLTESAELIAITKAPSYYLQDKEKLAKQTQYLLKHQKRLTADKTSLITPLKDTGIKNALKSNLVERKS